MARSARFAYAFFGALGLAFFAAPAPAGQREAGAALRLSIPAGTLDRALQALATQARIQILYPPELVEGRKAPGLQLRLPPAQALQALLRGSGLEAVAVSGNAYVLRRAALPPPRPQPPGKPRPDPAVELETVQVTGTHIPRASLDVLTPAPLTVIGRAEIEASGQQSLFELLSYQPGMIGLHPVEIASEGSLGTQQLYGAAASSSLYGLGPRATLFLVDGRRVASYGLISAELGGLTDLDGIPLSMIERIEIMRGGASAIYGADAMAGVVNIILKRDQRGEEATLRYGASERGDAEQLRLTFSHGQPTRGGGSLLLGADLFHREGLLGGQREWRSDDLRRFGLGDYRIQLGYLGPDGRVIRPACPAAQRDAQGGCALDQARHVTLQPELESRTVYANLQQPLADSLELRADLRLGRVEQRLQGAPMFTTVTLPASHPDAIRYQGRSAPLAYAFFDVGPVRSRNEADVRDLTVGLAGTRDRWQWQFDLAHHRNDAGNTIDGLVMQDRLNQAVAERSYRFNGAGNPPDVLAWLAPRLRSRGRAQLDQALFSANAPVFELPGGTAQVAAGGEFGRDALRSEPDPRILERDVVGGTQKPRLDAHRYQSALYAELSLPVLRRLHADVAWRLDHIQGYGSEVSPKLGLKWNALPTLTLRGTAATGYRAPSLFELRSPSTLSGFHRLLPMQPAMAPCAVAIPMGDAVWCALTVGSKENPDLQPETSRSHTLGAVWAPSSRFELSLDHFSIRRRNEIVVTDAVTHPELFPQALERDASGRLVAINDYYENLGRTRVQGWELQASYRLDTARFGRYALRLSGHYLDEFATRAHAGAPEIDRTGYDRPRHSALAGIQWSYRDWNTALNLHALGPVKIGEPGAPCPPRNAAAGKCTTPASRTLDLHLAYAGIPGWRLALNIDNLTDREPANYAATKGGYDLAYDDPRGRYYLLSASYRF
ncbi:TonB-dependent receptor [Vulcaniibacterium tengchongense]|uniref:Outer membrane receptor protein involved in Fe transport n=1 Tax=Vulcaniibacterium tengchongense TaxID=1273429 RepID=A0A3N4V4F0_9GAMM|nr:TonB-dependent receptor [Vulcaniibacterium tengchongense]RPE76943.1 outer membrane receptor protein involved in Fe transport [Vulcaniibacterium tengchongense]